MTQGQGQVTLAGESFFRIFYFFQNYYRKLTKKQFFTQKRHFFYFEKTFQKSPSRLRRYWSQEYSLWSILLSESGWSQPDLRSCEAGPGLSSCPVVRACIENLLDQFGLFYFTLYTSQSTSPRIATIVLVWVPRGCAGQFGPHYSCTVPVLFNTIGTDKNCPLYTPISM